MKKIENNLQWLPIICYVGFFMLYIVLGVLLISGVFVPDLSTVTDAPLYEPLTYVDLLILLAMNIPTFAILSLAVKRTMNKQS
ncbi:MAG: hypothetical protein RTU63_00110 [Candidatus Thorarchaeota archaeon]